MLAKANLPNFPLALHADIFRLGCKIVHAKPASSLGYSSIGAGGGVNAMFTFTIEGCVVVVVNGRFVKEEPPLSPSRSSQQQMPFVA